MTADTNNITIVQGQTAVVTIKLIDGNTGNPFNLSGLTGATGMFPSGDGTQALAVTGIVQSEDLGSLTFTMDKDTTELLSIGEAQNIQVQVDQGATRSIAQLQSVLTVAGPLFTF